MSRSYRKHKRVSKKYAWYTPIVDFFKNADKRTLIVIGGAALVLLVAILLPIIFLSGQNNTDDVAEASNDAISLPNTTLNQTPTPVSEPTPTPEVIPTPTPILFQYVDFSDERDILETDFIQINEPTPWKNELIYTAGKANNILGQVMENLVLYDLTTKEETVLAETQLSSGELYECKMSDDYIVWLDTDQAGTNKLYYYDRATEETKLLTDCNKNKPQLRLSGANLVWVEQFDATQDRLRFYNFLSGEPIIMEPFENATYGTCPPSIYGDLLVWVVPYESEEPTPDPDATPDAEATPDTEATPDAEATPEVSEGERSLIKILDLSVALNVHFGDSTAGGDEATSETTPDVPADLTPDPNATPEPEEESDPGLSVYDPESFAIYPATNGREIAFIDNLNPSLATLDLVLEDHTTIAVDTGIGRLFGLGEEFLVYTKDDVIWAYYWGADEAHRYVRLTKEGHKGRLSRSCVSGYTVAWYDADDLEEDDIVYISHMPTLEELMEMEPSEIVVGYQE